MIAYERKRSIPFLEIAVIVPVVGITATRPVVAASSKSSPVVTLAATAAPVIPAAGIIIPCTKVLPIAACTPAPVIIAVGTVIRPVLNEGPIVEFQLAFGDRLQLALDIIVMHQFFVPVAVSKLHIIGDRVGKTLALFRVLFP